MISRQHQFSSCFIVSVLLGVWTEVTRGEPSIQLDPLHPVIAGSVTLTVTGINGKLLSFLWHKGLVANERNHIFTYFTDDGKIFRGPLFHGRMDALPTGSLKISNLNRTDEGNYIVKIKLDKGEEDSSVNLTIYEKVVKPTVTANTLRPKENDKVILTCNTTNADRILWSKVNANLPPGANISSSNITLTLHNINRTDSGEYKCEVVNIVSTNISDPYKLDVSYGPESVVVEKEKHGNSVTLVCSAISVPPPTYQWRLNGTDLKDKQNPLLVDITVPENIGNYECVVNNSATHQTANKSIYIDMGYTVDSRSENLGTIIGSVVAVFLLVVLVAALVYFCIIHRRQKKQKADSLHTATKGGNSRNGQANTRAPGQEPPEIQYADIVIQNMPRKEQPPPETVYANRIPPVHPPRDTVVYSELRIN